MTGELQLVHRGDIVIRVAVLDGADPLEDRVEQGQLDASAPRYFPNQLEVLEREARGNPARYPWR